MGASRGAEIAALFRISIARPYSPAVNAAVASSGTFVSELAMPALTAAMQSNTKIWNFLLAIRMSLNRGRFGFHDFHLHAVAQIGISGQGNQIIRADTPNHFIVRGIR